MTGAYRQSAALRDDERSDWLDLLPWMTPAERRTLLDSEHAAMTYATALRAAGVPQQLAFEPAALDVLAQVCCGVHGTPGELMEGRAVASAH